MKRALFSAFALALLVAPAVVAQMDQKPMTDCATMMKQHEAMQKQMTDMDAKLDKLVAEMNKARGSKKVDKMAEVITEMVSQRQAMSKEMMTMQPAMMHHMMQHMQAGMKAMMDCPMMKESQTAAAEPEHKH